ncbi:MAG: sorbosone dehydrogenase family protein [Fimbriimonadaceae bacterium]
MKRLLLPLALAASALAPAQPLSLAPVVSGFDRPVEIIQDPLRSNVQFVLNQSGAVRVVQDGVLLPTPMVTLPVLLGSERGLLGMAFAPDHETSGHIYFNFTISGVYMQLARYTRVGDALTVDPATRFNIFRSLRPFANHNAGCIRFGPDGYLYLPTGDGGSSGDPGNRAQTPTQILGKMLRLDPSGDDFPSDPEANYRIPSSNPFRPANNPPIAALEEIWAFGLRNPWKFAFDDPTKLGTGALVLADVGQSTREEVNYEPAGQGGRNYGWKRFEGTFLFSSGTALAYSPHTPPIHEYPRTQGQSVTGGGIYRGLQLGPEYFGRYFLADYLAGRAWSLSLLIDPITGEAGVTNVTDHTTDFGGIGFANVSSFGVDGDGELFLIDYSGTVNRIVRNETTWLTAARAVQGPYLGGQVRSLILSDGKTFDVQALRLASTSPLRAGVDFDARTNRSTRTLVGVSVSGKVNQSLSVPVALECKNWNTGLFEQVATGNWGSMLNSLSASGLDGTKYVDGGGNVQCRVAISYNGILLASSLQLKVEAAAVTVD